MSTTDRTRLHYTTLLAPIYRWMLGDISSAMDRARTELLELGVGAGQPGARALDLGAGLGLHASSLVALGYEVTALDSSETLLAELSRACTDVRVVHADLASLAEVTEGSYDVVVCMGDTLSHLGSDAAVRALLGEVSGRLRPGGLFAITFRDYSGSPPPRSSDRFILVRSDAERILTCRLDYADERVFVTDIVHELSGGQWSLRTSEYEKLRLSPATVASELARHGLLVERCDSVSGRVAIAARRALR